MFTRVSTNHIHKASSVPARRNNKEPGKQSAPVIKDRLRSARAIPDVQIPQSLGFASGYGSQAKDLLVEAVEFTDFKPTTEKPVLNYHFRDIQTFFAPGTIGGSGTNVAKLNRIEVYALPRAVNGAVASTSYAILYGTPAYSGITPEAATGARLVSQHNKLVNPTFNVHWQRVGSTNFDTVFKSSQLLPVRYSENTATSGLVGFQLSAIDPDNKAIITDPIQLKIVSVYTVTLPVETTIQVAETYTQSFADEAE